MKRLALAAALAAVAGCAGLRPAPPLSAPVIPPDHWRTNFGEEADIAADWWQGFGDPRLTAMVERALRNNTDIFLASARVEEARAQFRLADAQRMPSIIALLGGARKRDVSAFGHSQDQTAGQALLGISYDIDLFGRLASTSHAARANLLASKAAQASVRLAVQADTANGYIGLLFLDARLALVRKTLAARAEGLRIARRRAEAGYTSNLEMYQAEAEYRATEQLVAPTELAIVRQENGLSILLGERPRSVERGLSLATISIPRTPSRLPAQLLRRRPDIVEAEFRIIASERSLDAARAAFMPDIELSATGGYVASTLLLGDPLNIFSLGASILAPLFEGGRLRAQADVAASRRNQAAFNYRRTALVAFREVEDALAAVLRTREQEQALIVQQDALAAELVIATNRYQAGYSSYLDQLDAQRSLLSAQLSLVQARADRLAATVQLYRGLGGGWNSERVEEARL